MSLSEAQVKQAVEEYLQYQQNLGKLFYLRLNSGDAFINRGGKSYKIQLCPKGTADLMVIQISQDYPTPIITFVELKSSKGKQSPEQVEFAMQIVKFNCGYIVVRSVEELMEWLN